ncbi:MAG: type IV pilus modification protein PilV [Methylococcales bacterium]|nr:type IV pilus modification protein PilV [Methylococcales bacterium]
MKRHRGFTLIEILIAMLVLAIGLLGLAGLQATGLKNNQSAYNRSQATQLAYDLADRMRANVAGVATYTAILPSAATAKANCLTTTGCIAADMAENDLFEWNSAISNVLPSGSGTICLGAGCTPAAAANVFKVTITWDDDRDGDNNNNLSFQTYFQL